MGIQDASPRLREACSVWLSAVFKKGIPELPETPSVHRQSLFVMSQPKKLFFQQHSAGDFFFPVS